MNLICTSMNSAHTGISVIRNRSYQTHTSGARVAESKSWEFTSFWGALRLCDLNFFTQFFLRNSILPTDLLCFELLLISVNNCSCIFFSIGKYLKK